MNPGDAEVVDTKTSTEIEEGGEKHKAPDERRRPVKTINDMKSIPRDKEGEVFGHETAETTTTTRPTRPRGPSW